MVLEVSNTAANIRSATVNDREALLDLLHSGMFVHRHMDWKMPLDWLGQDPFLVLNRFEQPAAMIACPPDPAEVAWIRAFAVNSLIPRSTAWDKLWASALTRLQDQPEVERVVSIVMDDWFKDLLIRSGFEHHTSIVLLSWENNGRRLEPPLNPTSVRPMTLADLPEVARIDNQAFKPLWHNSLESLELAFVQALIATVSEDEHGLTGYQISTPSPFGGHLARLAVQPEKQGQGIGYAIVYDLLQRFQAKGALRVTVNTQQENTRSQEIYKKARFHLTGESYPIYQYLLPR